VAPDFGAEVNGGEDGGSIYPDVVEDVCVERGDEMERMGVKVWDTGDIAKEVPVNKFLLSDPKLLAVVVDDCILVGVLVDDEGTGGRGKEVGEEIG